MGSKKLLNDIKGLNGHQLRAISNIFVEKDSNYYIGDTYYKSNKFMTQNKEEFLKTLSSFSSIYVQNPNDLNGPIYAYICTSPAGSREKLHDLFESMIAMLNDEGKNKLDNFINKVACAECDLLNLLEFNCLVGLSPDHSLNVFGELNSETGQIDLSGLFLDHSDVI